MSYLKRFTQKSCVLGLVLVALVPLAAWAQGDNTAQQNPGGGDQSASGSPQQDQTAPAPAFGSAVTIPSVSENPPISGLDQPSLEPGTITRSFLAPGAILSQSAGSNVAGAFGSGENSSGTGGITRAMGSLTLQRIWSRYETDLQYVGGGIFYEGVSHSAGQTHEAEFAQRAIWRTGQLAFRDSLSYLPEGNFGGGSYGGVSALQSGLAGIGAGPSGMSYGIGDALVGTLSAGQFGSAGEAPRLTNSAVVDLVQSLSPRSTFTLAGSYGFVHFTNNPFGLIDSGQTTAQSAFNRQINRTDQIAVSYGFQNFRFPQVSGSTVTTNTVHLVYGHRVTGRLDLIAAAGPQFTHIQSPLFGSNTTISASGNLKLRYRFPRTSMQMEYRHYNTNGSGYFLGASTDVGTLSVFRPLGRVWEVNSDIGIANNKRLEPSSPVVSATSDRSIYAGAAVHRHVGRRYRM
ncbi:MAG: hypothetical protein ACRD2S_01335, partial [Terriglobales bacterium]